jgi:hypothetical protein
MLINEEAMNAMWASEGPKLKDRNRRLEKFVNEMKRLENKMLSVLAICNTRAKERVFSEMWDDMHKALEELEKEG